MASPFCTICTELTVSKGHRWFCKAFPLGIPEAVYPSGCGPRGTRDFGFQPKRRFEQMARHWTELDRKEGGAASVLFDLPPRGASFTPPSRREP